MKSKKQIEKMLSGFIVGRPKSRNQAFKGHDLLLFSDYGAMTVYAVTPEGFATLDRIDIEAGEFFIEEFSRPISLDYLIVFSPGTGVYEYYEYDQI